MSVTLYNIEFFDEFTGLGGGGIDLLAGCIGDKITAEITFDVSWATVDKPLIFTADGQTIQRNDIVTFTFPVTPPKTNCFSSFISDGFKVGDTIVIEGTTLNDGTYTIAAITDTIITTVEPLVSETVTSGTIYGYTPITAIDFYYNIIENNDLADYKSRYDTAASNRYNCDTVSIGMGITEMIPVGSSRGWVNDDGTSGTGATIQGTAYPYTADYVQRFRIYHTFFITPLFLANWKKNLDTISNPINFYSDFESLKYICKIEAKFDNLQTTPSHTGDFIPELKKGNVGFFNEFVNGFHANYTLKSISFTDVITAASVDNLQYGRETDVDIRITSTHSVFSAGCKVVLNNLYAPLDTTDYTDTGTDVMIENYRFDRILLTEGAAATDGEQFGTDMQSITDAQATLIGADELKITFRCSLATAFSTFIAGKDTYNRNYILFATPQDIDVITTTDFDRNAVLCDFGTFTTDERRLSLWSIFCRTAYGALYNWYAATNVKEITSNATWGVPSDDDWTTLDTYLGGSTVSGGKLKEAGTTHWKSPNTGATNAVNFSAVAGGGRYLNGVFYNITENGGYWSITEYDRSEIYIRYMDDGDAVLFRDHYNKEYGFSVRLVRVATVAEQALPDGTYLDMYTGNDGKKYKTVKIGTQVWTAENLNETKYRTGAAIPNITDNATWAADTTGAYCYYNNVTQYGISCNNVLFYEYPNLIEGKEGYTDYKGFSNDLVLARAFFQLESLYNAQLQSLSVKIEAEKAGEDNIVLEQHDFNLSAFPLTDELIQEISIQEATNFDVRSGSDFEYYTIDRAESEDYDNYIVYLLQYPFRVRYETWIDLISKAFPNGTQDWSYYQEQGWEIKFNVYASVKDHNTDFVTDFKHQADLALYSFDSTATAITCVIKTYNNTGTTETDGLILNSENTFILATFTMADTTVPAGYDDWYGYLAIDSPEIGGIYYNRYASTEEAAETNAIWATDATLTVVDGTTITLSASIDYTKLKELSAGKYPLKQLALYARIGLKV